MDKHHQQDHPGGGDNAGQDAASVSFVLLAPAVESEENSGSSKVRKRKSRPRDTFGEQLSDLG